MLLNKIRSTGAMALVLSLLLAGQLTLAEEEVPTSLTPQAVAQLVTELDSSDIEKQDNAVRLLVEGGPEIVEPMTQAIMKNRPKDLEQISLIYGELSQNRGKETADATFDGLVTFMNGEDELLAKMARDSMAAATPRRLNYKVKPNRISVVGIQANPSTKHQPWVLPFSPKGIATDIYENAGVRSSEMLLGSGKWFSFRQDEHGILCVMVTVDKKNVEVMTTYWAEDEEQLKKKYPQLKGSYEKLKPRRNGFSFSG